MKVLGISTSRRKWGNTDIVVYAALKAAAAQGAEIKLLRPAELEIKPCNGCMRCVFQQRDCVIPDRFGEINEALRWADAIVLGAPTYVLAPNSIQKNLQDRLIRMGQSHEMRGKTGVAIATAGVRGWEALALPLLTQNLLFMGIDVVDRFVAKAQGPGEVLDNTEALARAARAGSALGRGEKSYLGEPGHCPVCNLDVVTVDGPGRGACKICEIGGTVDARGVFTPDAGARARHSKEAIDHHFNENVLPSGPRFMEKVRDYRARTAEFHKGFED